MVNKVNVKKSRSKLVMIIAAAVLLIAPADLLIIIFHRKKLPQPLRPAQRFTNRHSPHRQPGHLS